MDTNPAKLICDARNMAYTLPDYSREKSRLLSLAQKLERIIVQIRRLRRQ
ncbi:hypothetical protein HFQ13_10575 [Acidithiobacillus sp. VAN18-1]|uniref:Uncharacterized protein n=1 Tax=Igneacidithiobacillus copahuensis TaxID=2724909 RepID=A0AAE2YR03_9PROT|nr:hypothetical protein [Igneacidithiobacillus copahuensis]MBU2788635.1 hypothetical protein [Igneacidithiobacillus copahuensis]MBU2796681.1 hypothetical protein [Acidithiobacillus sp. VAN18-2]